MSNRRKLPTQERLQELLEYRDGHLYWRRSARGRRMGVPIGCISKGYRHACIDGKNYRHSRLVWVYHKGPIEDPTLQIDHRNRIKNDDRIENLALVTVRENNLNKGNNTATPGVIDACNGSSSYVAQASFGGRQNYLGSYDSIESASKAYRMACAHIELGTELTKDVIDSIKQACGARSLSSGRQKALKGSVYRDKAGRWQVSQIPYRKALPMRCGVYDTEEAAQAANDELNAIRNATGTLTRKDVDRVKRKHGARDKRRRKA